MTTRDRVRDTLAYGLGRNLKPMAGSLATTRRRSLRARRYAFGLGLVAGSRTRTPGLGAALELARIVKVGKR